MRGGSAAGHNGLKDIQAQLGSPEFWRLRLGIGHPGARSEVAAFVLRKPSAAEREAIERNIDETLAHLDVLISGAMDKATLLIHAKPQRPGKPRPPASPDPTPPRNAPAPDAGH